MKGMSILALDWMDCECGASPVFKKSIRGNNVFLHCPVCGQCSDHMKTPRGAVLRWNKKMDAYKKISGHYVAMHDALISLSKQQLKDQKEVNESYKHAFIWLEQKYPQIADEFSCEALAFLQINYPLNKAIKTKKDL